MSSSRSSILFLIVTLLVVAAPARALEKWLYQPTNLLVDSGFAGWLAEAQPRWRRAIVTAQQTGIAVPALSASLAYFDSYRSAILPQNLTQAQRDFFGAHTYERIDKPQQGAIHTEWADLLKEKATSR